MFDPGHSLNQRILDEQSPRPQGQGRAMEPVMEPVRTPMSLITPEAMSASDDDPSNHLLGSSISYRIAVKPQQGRKVFTLQALPDCRSDDPFSSSVGEVAGISLRAGVATKANERAKLEGLCRYITRPAVHHWSGPIPLSHLVIVSGDWQAEKLRPLLNSNNTQKLFRKHLCTYS